MWRKGLCGVIGIWASSIMAMALTSTCSTTVYLYRIILHRRDVEVQEMGMAAAVRGDATLLKQAMLHDPLAGAVYYKTSP